MFAGLHCAHDRHVWGHLPGVWAGGVSAWGVDGIPIFFLTSSLKGNYTIVLLHIHHLQHHANIKVCENGAFLCFVVSVCRVCIVWFKPIESRYCWVSELCASSLNGQLGTFSMSTPLTKTSCDEVNLSSTLSHERLTCMSLMLALCVILRASYATQFWANCNFPKSLFVAPGTTRLNSSPGATKLGPVGPAVLIVLLTQSSALLWTDFFPS